MGYQLGFTNLSHFSRVFQEHIGMKPKQYSKS
ncbi:MAG TPA: AraC family transcriptional regulator [Bacteroidales bacterium]